MKKITVFLASLLVALLFASCGPMPIMRIGLSAADLTVDGTTAREIGRVVYDSRAVNADMAAVNAIYDGFGALKGTYTPSTFEVKIEQCAAYRFNVDKLHLMEGGNIDYSQIVAEVINSLDGVQTFDLAKPAATSKTKPVRAGSYDSIWVKSQRSNAVVKLPRTDTLGYITPVDNGDGTGTYTLDHGWFWGNQPSAPYVFGNIGLSSAITEPVFRPRIMSGAQVIQSESLVMPSNIKIDIPEGSKVKLYLYLNTEGLISVYEGPSGDPSDDIITLSRGWWDRLEVRAVK